MYSQIVNAKIMDYVEAQLQNLKSPAFSEASRICFLVLGMHRSGTSATSRVLSILGCDLPRTLLGANETNETGHWESDVIVTLNDALLDSAGSNWRDWTVFNQGWYSSPRAAEFRDRALAAIEDEFGDSRLFVLKDPRIGRFAPFWLDVLKAAEIEPAIVLPIRNPLEVAASLEKRDGMDSALGHLLWLRYILDAEMATRGAPRFHCTYDDLLDRWPAVISRLQSTFEITLPRFSALVGEEIAAYLGDKYRHHKELPKNLLENPLLSLWLREAYEIFLRWSDGGEDSEDYPTLDDIRAEFNAATPAFAPLVLSGQRASEQVRRLEAAVAATRAENAKLEGELAHGQQDAQNAKAQLMEAQNALSTTQSSLAQRQAEADEMSSLLAQAQEQLASKEKELSEARAALAQREAEVDAKTAQLAKSEAQLVNLELDLGQERSQAQEQLASKEKELSEARAALAQREAEVGAKTAQFAKSEARLVNLELDLERERGHAEARLSERFEEIASLSRIVATKETQAQHARTHAEWLRQTAQVLRRSSHSFKDRLLALLPVSYHRKRQLAELRRKRLFDGDAYLEAHPDVAKNGLDPLQHYIAHGMAEGRRLGFDGK